mgnify:CR=1 FL=1
MTAPQAVARHPALLIRAPSPAAEAEARRGMVNRLLKNRYGWRGYTEVRLPTDRVRAEASSPSPPPPYAPLVLHARQGGALRLVANHGVSPDPESRMQASGSAILGCAANTSSASSTVIGSS